MAKACRADIKKAIVKTAAKRMNMELYSPVDGAEDTFYIKNSARKTGDKYNTKRNNILNDVKQDMLKLNKSFKDKVRAVLIKTDDTSDMQVVLKISPMYVEHEFNKLPEEKRNNVFVDLEEDEVYFQDSQSVFEQDFTEGITQKELDNLFSYTKEIQEVDVNSNTVKASIKALGILESEKAIKLFNILLKNKVTGNNFWNKVQSDLQIPKEQIELLKQYNITDREQLITNILADYSYAIEINVAKTKPSIFNMDPYKGFEFEGSYYKRSEKGTPLKDGKRINNTVFNKIMKEASKKKPMTNSEAYSNLTVPGGTNYTENEIATPAITPSIKGHAQFATDKGIGWFRSDDKGTGTEIIKNINNLPDSFTGKDGLFYFRDGNRWMTETENGTLTSKGETDVVNAWNKAQEGSPTKTRRILEVQSDLFQKGRDSELLVNTLNRDRKDNVRILQLENISYDRNLTKEEEQELKKLKEPNFNKAGNEFLQLLNKDNNWVTFFIKSIIQDSAKKGYEKVVFPTGSTAYKIESGGSTIEDFIKNKKNRIKKLEKDLETLPKTENGKYVLYNIDEEDGSDMSEVFDTLKEAEEYQQRNSGWTFGDEKVGQTGRGKKILEIEQLKKEIDNAEAGVSGLAATAKFYQENVANVLRKQGYNPKVITDEYGNTWNEITIESQRDKENIYFQTESAVKNEEGQEPKQASKQLDSAIANFLSKIGVSLVHVYAIRDSEGNLIDAVAKASMLNKIIEVVDGKASIDTLPEEAAHFFVEMLGEGHPLYKEMFDKIEGYDVYKTTLAQYKNIPAYRLANGDINYDKIKKEAMGKLIAKHIIEMDPGAETDANLEKAYTWWQKLWEFVTNIFNRSTDNPFEEAAIRILMGETEGLSDENLTKFDDEYYQLTDPVQLLIQDQANITLDNSVDPRTQQKRHIYFYGGVQGKGSVTSVYVDRWLKKIFRTDSREELQKKVDLMKAEFGDVVHEQLQDIIKSWTNPDGTRKDVQDRVEMKVGSAEFKLLNNYIEEVLDQYDVGTRFFAEFKIFDKKTQIAGSIDLMVIEPDGTVEIYDWKTQEIFKDQTDIKTYKEPMYRIQLNAYRNILEAQYGFTKFGRIRAIPIATSFNWRGGVPTNLKSLEIGSLDLESIPEDKSYLLPVALRTESTGDTQLDSLIQKLYAIYDKIQNQKNRYTKEEVFKKREELSQFRTAIRDLQLRNKVDRLVELGLVEFKKYSEKLEKKSLKGGEIPEALSILKVFSQSGVTLYELRQELLDSIDKEDTKAIKAFKDMNEKFLLMTSKVSKLMDDIQEYRKEQTDELGKRNGIMGLLNPEQAIGTLKGWFSSLSNIKQKAFRVFSMLLRRVQSIRDAKFDETSDKLLELKKNFATWAAARGMSPDKAMEMILNIDEKGNWNGNFLSTYKKEFYDARKKAIDTTNIAWLAENTVFDNEKYEASEDKQREFFESVIYASDEQENEAIITKKINEWITQHRVINPNGTLNIAALSNPNNRFLKPDEKWHTEKWKNLNKSENKPLKEMYDYFQSLIRQAEGNGMLDKYSPHFIPSIMKDKMDQLVFGDVKSLFSGKGTFQNLQVDSGTQYTPETDPTTGQIINRLPVYFTNDMGVKNEETGEVDYSRKSRDLFKVFATWAAHMYNYEAMGAIEDDALMLLEVEKNKSSLVVDGFGRIVMEGGRPKQTEENRRNSELLENFVNYYLYDRTNGKFNDVAFKNPFSKDGKEYSLLKSLNAAIRFFSLKTLGLNIGSGTANFVGGTGNALFAAQKGIIFTKKGWASAVYKVTSGDKKAMAALDYMNILLEGRKSQLINELSLSATNGILNSDNLFIIQRTSDKAVQYPIAVAIMENNMIRDGKLVDISAFVKEKYNYNNTFYNLSESERSAMINKIEKEVTELKEKESILAIGKLDEKGNFSIPGVVKTEAGVYGELRDKIKGASKKVLGNSSRDDINAIRTTMLGSALMQFRNWMPEMVEDRVGGLQYDDELGIWTYGRMNQWVTQGFWKNSGIMLKSIVTGFGDDATKSAKDSYERMKRDAYEKGDDFTITEGEFVDMYIGNLRSMGTELLVLIAFTALILGVVSAAGDDDDDENKGTKKYIARMLKKYYSEFAFYFNPIEFTRLVKNPIPVVGLAEDFFRFTGNVIEEVYGRASGNEELTKKAKPLKYLFRALPVAKEALLIMAAFNDEFRKEWDIQLKPGGSY